MTRTRSRYQKRHYEDMATILRITRPTILAGDSAITIWAQIRKEMIQLFKNDNPTNFDADRFEVATVAKM